MKRVVVLACCCVLGIAALASAMNKPAEVISAPTFVAPERLDLDAVAAKRVSLYDRLVAGAARHDVVDLGQLTQAEMSFLADDLTPQRRRMLVGVDRKLGLEVDLVNLSKTVHGGVHSLFDGTLVYTITFRSPGATAMRAHVTDLALPKGSELYVYGKRGDAFGPYTGAGPFDQGELWTNTVLGEVLTLQLEVSNPSWDKLFDSYFVVDSIGHMGEQFDLARWQAASTDKSFCTSGTGPINEDCVENASCSSIPSAVAAAEHAIAEMLFASGGGYYICTGGLVNNSNSDGTPYFLTANHCISTSSEASSLETYWDFTVPCGTTVCSYAWAGGRTSPGGSIVSASSTSDYTLLLLPSVPSGRAFLGWNATAVAYANGTGLYRISHPSGAPQAYSEHSVSTSAGTCSSWPRGNWIYSKDTYGATEGGSSGSPVLNGSGQIVGQLSGACGYNPSDPCDDVSNATVDGAFAAYFSNVSPWLDPGGSCVPSTEVCDGADNDCDGEIDEDGVCDQPVCGERGDWCDSNDDCCSNRCFTRRHRCR